MGADSWAPDWDLSRLMPDGPAGAGALAREAVSLAERFEREHEGRIAVYDAEALRAALEQLERIQEAIGCAQSYATLRFDADSRPPQHGALLSEVEELGARVETLTNFFELEWIGLDEELATALLGESPLEPYRHLLTVQRRWRAHRLSAAEERILTEKHLTGADAWERLLEEQLASLEPELNGEPTPLTEVEALLSSPEREKRVSAAASITAALAPGLALRTRILNVLCADHAVEDRLRHFPHWLAQLNLENEAPDSSVQALTEAVVGRYEIARRWLRLKARALGLDRLTDVDRFAPVGSEPPRFTWEEAHELVVSSYADFSEELAALAERFFAESWIDAAVRPGKQPGAYCAHTVPAANPFLLLSFAGRREDLLTLAHELGHGLHFLLAAPRGILQMDTPVTVAETSSVFGEALAFAHLLSRETDPVTRFGLLAYQLDEVIGTVFRQVALHRFEGHVHTGRRARGELSADQLGELWMSAHSELYGDSLELTEDYRCWWSWSSHVFVLPGYVYSYAYGQLLALACYARYLDEGASFVSRYLDMLRAGGSRSPETLAAMVGIDLSDPHLWDAGLDLIDDLVTEAERAVVA